MIEARILRLPSSRRPRERASTRTCRYCGERKVSVVDCRQMSHGVRRRLVCEGCNRRWKTIEVPQEFSAHSMPDDSVQLARDMQRVAEQLLRRAKSLLEALP